MGFRISEDFWNFVIMIGLFAMIGAGLLAYFEFKGAEKFCNSIDGKYAVKVFPLPPAHTCNGKPLIAYTSGWEFEGERADLSNFIIEVPTNS